MPKEFQSELVVIENGREVLTKVIEVNDPLTYKGSLLPVKLRHDAECKGKFVLDITPAGTGKKTLAGLWSIFEIPGTGIKAGSTISPCLTRDRNTGRLITYSETMVNLLWP